MSLSKVIEVARGELGYTETPVNRTKYWQDYDPSFQGQPWCVAFLWWVFQQAGERMAFFGGGRTASCGTLLRWYREQGLTVPLEDVQVGDIVILNFHGTKDTEHCGLVTGISDIRNLSSGMPVSVWTIEGNTSSADGSQSNGGTVCEKRRFPNQIVAVCRPMYKEEEMQKGDISGHWAEKAIRRCMKRGLLKGYPDGSFQPDKPVTRAELAVILDRIMMEGDGK